MITWRRWEIYALLAGVLGLVVLFIGAPIWLDLKLHRAVDAFGVPSTMRLTQRHTEGDFFCVITCLGKSTELTFTSSADATTACRILRRHLERHGYTPEPPPLSQPAPERNPCLYWAKARRIRKRATMTATVLPYEPTTIVVRFSANNG